RVVAGSRTAPRACGTADARPSQAGAVDLLGLPTWPAAAQHGDLGADGGDREGDRSLAQGGARGEGGGDGPRVAPVAARGARGARRGGRSPPRPVLRLVQPVDGVELPGRVAGAPLVGRLGARRLAGPRRSDPAADSDSGPTAREDEARLGLRGRAARGDGSL